jgi:hypothetical protein
LAVKDELCISSVVALETAIGLTAAKITVEKILHSCLERGIDWTSEERRQIIVLLQAIQKRRAAERRDNKGDNRKKQSEAAR